MKQVTYQPLWLLEMVDSNCEIDKQKLLTKNIPTRPEKGLFSTGIFTKTEQIALGQDLYDTANLREIYYKAESETFDLLSRLVRSWQFTTFLNKLRQETLK